MKDLILFGIQGSGKGTQAELIIKSYPENFSYVSMGNIFRALSKGHENAIGKYTAEQIESGKLINDKVTSSLFAGYFYSAMDQEKNMLIDGYPRTIEQLEDIIRLASEEKRDLIGIHLTLSREQAMERMKSRGRSDDTDESMRFRIEQFYEQTLPVIEHFGKDMQLFEIDASRTIEEIATDIKEVVSGKDTKSDE